MQVDSSELLSNISAQSILVGRICFKFQQRCVRTPGFQYPRENNDIH